MSEALIGVVGVIAGALISEALGTWRDRRNARRESRAYWRNHLHAGYAQAFRIMRLTEDAWRDVDAPPDVVDTRGTPLAMQADHWLSEEIWGASQKVANDLELIAPEGIVEDLRRLGSLRDRETADEHTDQLRRRIRRHLGIEAP